MPATFVLIASNILSSPSTSVTFSSIPGTYTDLVLRASIRDNTASIASNGFYIYPNGSTANGSSTILYGDGNTSTAGSYRNVGIWPSGQGNNATANTFGSLEIYIPSYTASTNKPMSIRMAIENNGTNGWNEADAGLWSNTAAITSLELKPYSTASFVSGSSFYLYGIKNS